MSTLTEVLATRNQLIANYDFSKLALGNNEFVYANYTASEDVELAAGLVLAKVSATGALTTLDPTASDGSQYPFGILYLGINGSVEIASGDTENFTLINKGRIDESLLVFPDGVTIDDVITNDSRTVKDLLNVMGLILEGGTELTKLDNQ